MEFRRLSENNSGWYLPMQVSVWKGDIRDYKALLAKKMGLSKK